MTPPTHILGTACWREIGVHGGDQSCDQLAVHVHCRNCPVFATEARRLLDREVPAAGRSDSTLSVARPEIRGGARLSVLIFRIGDEWLALELSALVEVLETRPVHRIPHRAHPYLAGLVNVRGQLLLCASLSGVLGLPAKPTVRARIVHLLLGDDRWTFIADEVEGLHQVAADTQLGVPSTVSGAMASYTRCLFLHGERAVGLLNADAVVDALRREVG